MSFLHTLSFILAGVLLIVGIAGLTQSNSIQELRACAMPGIFFGGAILIASLYALKECRHGLAGASFLAFLAFLTNAASFLGAHSAGRYNWNTPGDRSATLLFLATLLYLAVAFTRCKRSRRQRAMEEWNKT